MPGLGGAPSTLLWTFPNGATAMLGPTKVAISFVLIALSLMMQGTTTNADSKLPDRIL
jgi:NhaP-type Na+/H+ and K+/H+ antiporter